MIKSCHRSAGMTECLINFKYTVFGQPNEIRWKILSQMAGRPIFKLCVGSCRGGFVPIITFILSCNRSFRFHPETTEGVIVSRPLGKKGDKYFRQSASLCSTWRFHKSSTCHFPGTIEHLSISAPLTPSHQALFLTSDWGWCRCPSPGQPAQESNPLCRRDEATALCQIHAVKCIRGSLSLQTYTRKIPFALRLL